jgi:nicotinic acid mononucleotide adenylyltransferase
LTFVRGTVVSAVNPDSKAARASGVADRIGRTLRSPSTRLAAFAGLLTYLCYAYAHDSWTNPALIGVAVFFAVFMPTYTRLSNKAELWGNNRFGFITAGRLARFVPQFAFNLAVFAVMLWGGGMSRNGVASVGGIAGAALITTLASQGLQYLGSYLLARGIGDINRNVLAGLCINTALTALGTAGLPYGREGFLLLGFGLGGALLTIGILSDLRSILAPKGGIGLYFGTFNPFHVSHLAIIRRAMAERGLDRVIIHPTLIPRIHVDAFRKGEIRIGRIENGFQVYEKTDKADVNVDYFPTGRVFLPPETRHALIEIAVAEADLGDRVEVLFLRETYDRSGFPGVIAEIRKRHPSVRLHTLHGTDFGGMWVRFICDNCGWIYPWCILRRDNISATAIRAGATGMTSPAVTDMLAQISRNLPEVTAGGRRFRNDNGVLTESV